MRLTVKALLFIQALSYTGISVNLLSYLFPQRFLHKCYLFPPESAMCGARNRIQTGVLAPTSSANYLPVLLGTLPPPPHPGP